MKLRILFLITLLFALTLGCNKVNDLATTENDQNVNATLKSTWTEYSGTTVPTGFGDYEELMELPNDNVKILGFCGPWLEDVNPPLLSGPSVWCENVMYNKWKPKIHFWGDVVIEAANYGGEWHGHFNGYGYFQLMTDPDNGYNFFADPVKVEDLEVRFTGHGGEIQGMVAKAYYSIDMIETGFVYYIEGAYK